MADNFEMHDFKAMINIGQVGTGTLEGRITDLRVQELVLNKAIGKMEFMDNTVIRTDSKWQIVLEWELAGSALEPDILALKGSWIINAYLEGFGKDADELDLVGDSGNIELMNHKANEKSRINPTEAAWLYAETITIDPKTVHEGAYKLAVTVTYVKDDKVTPGPMAGFVELDHMIQIYKAT